MTRVTVLSGGVGGARFADGVVRALDADAVTVVVNTGDDLEHLGLQVCPDLDTVMYTLADLGDAERGWGLFGETWQAMEAVRRFGGPTWFNLGDRDLGTHLVRTAALRRGEPLSAITARLCGALGLRARILPMTDGACRTLIDTREHGTLAFQDWLVREHAPAVTRVRFEGSPPPAPGVLEAIAQADFVLLGPSNPYVSVDPILSIPGVREVLAEKTVVALSPIVGGRAVKGPLAEMIPALARRAASAGAIAAHYSALSGCGPDRGLLAGLVVERGDEEAVLGPAVLATSTVMRDRDDRLRLSREVLTFAADLARRGRGHA